MATKELSTAVSEDLLDEVWLMMHMAAEVGTYQAKTKSSPSRKYMFEAEVEPEYLSDVIETDNPGDGDKEKNLIRVAEKLMEMGDDFNTRNHKQADVQKLSGEIADYIRQVLEPDIERRLGPGLSRASATSLFSETGVLSLVYGVFKKKVEDFIGGDQDLTHIALVTSITKGVAHGLAESSSGVAGLLATVSTTYVKEKYGDFLQQKGSLTTIMTEPQQEAAQTEAVVSPQ